MGIPPAPAVPVLTDPVRLVLLLGVLVSISVMRASGSIGESEFSLVIGAVVGYITGGRSVQAPALPTGDTAP